MSQRELDNFGVCRASVLICRRHFERGNFEPESAADKGCGCILMLSVGRQPMTGAELSEITLTKIAEVEAFSQYDHVNLTGSQTTQCDLTETLKARIVPQIVLNRVKFIRAHFAVRVSLEYQII